MMIGNITSTCSIGGMNLSELGSSKPRISETTMDELIKALWQNFSKSFDKTEESSEEQKKKEALNTILSKADKDKDNMLSMEELKALDTSESKIEREMVKMLADSFSSLDKNKDGKLSLEEMEEILKKKAFSQQEIAQMAKDAHNERTILESPKIDFTQLASKHMIRTYEASLL